MDSVAVHKMPKYKQHTNTHIFEQSQACTRIGAYHPCLSSGQQLARAAEYNTHTHRDVATVCADSSPPPPKTHSTAPYIFPFTHSLASMVVVLLLLLLFSSSISLAHWLFGFGLCEQENRFSDFQSGVVSGRKRLCCNIHIRICVCIW